MPQRLTTSMFKKAEQLDGSNYRSWSFTMEMFLKANGLWNYVNGKSTRPEKAGEEQVKWDEEDQLAYSNIALSMAPSEHDHIRGAKTALIAWNRLEELYHGKTMPRLVSLIKKLTEAKLVDDPTKATMKDYIQGVMQTSSEISEIGHKLNDPIIMTFILIGLSERYLYLSVNLEEQIEEISFQNLTARLTEEERRLNPTMDSGTTQTIARPTIGQQGQMVTAYRAQFQCGKCGRNGHTSDQCGSRCDFCGGFNHSESNCRTKVFQENKSGIQPGAREKSNLYRR
jgi:hypothetical protein